MACQIKHNPETGKLEQVLAPNGKESILYQNLLKELQGNEAVALEAYKQIYTRSFKEWFGDWEGDITKASRMIDRNGEPMLVRGPDTIFNRTIGRKNKILGYKSTIQRGDDTFKSYRFADKFLSYKDQLSAKLAEFGFISKESSGGLYNIITSKPEDISILKLFEAQFPAAIILNLSNRTARIHDSLVGATNIYLNDKSPLQPFLEDEKLAPAKEGSLPVYERQLVALRSRIAQRYRRLAEIGDEEGKSSPAYKAYLTKTLEMEKEIEAAAKNRKEDEFTRLGENWLNQAEQYLESSSDKLNPEILEFLEEVAEAWKDYGPLSQRVQEYRKKVFPLMKQYVIDLIKYYYTGNPEAITEEILNAQIEDIDLGTFNTGTLVNLRNHIARTAGSIIKDYQNRFSRINKTFSAEMDRQFANLKKYLDRSGKSYKDVWEFMTHAIPSVGNKKTWALITKINPDGSVNQNYKKMMADPDMKEVREFYQFYGRVIESVKGKIPHLGQYIGNDGGWIPNVHKDDAKDWIRNLNPSKEITLTKSYFEELAADVVPLKYHRVLNTDEKSRDVGNSLIEFVFWANEYEQMAKALPKTRLLQRYLAETQDSNGNIVDRIFHSSSNPNKSYVATQSKLYKMVDRYIDMQIKGNLKIRRELAERVKALKYDSEGNPISEKYFDFTNLADNMLRWNSLLRIGLSPITAGANWLFGDITNTVEAIGGRFFNFKQLYQAGNIFMKEKSLTGWKQNSIVFKLLEALNPLMDLTDHEYLLKTKKGKRLSKEKFIEMMYSMQKSGELWIQSRTMLAIMIHDGLLTSKGKLTEEGEKLFKQDENGEYVNRREMEQLTEKIQGLNGLIHGRYSAREAAIAYQHVVYRMMSQFRKWLPAAVEQRFGKYRYDNRLKVDMEGRYRTLLKRVLANLPILSIVQRKEGDRMINSLTGRPLLALENLFLPLISYKRAVDRGNMSEMEVYNMRKNLTEILLLVGAVLLYGMTFGGDDDKDKRRRWEVKLLLSLANRLTDDLLFFYHPEGVNRIMQSAFPMGRLLNDLTYIISHPHFLFYLGDWEYKRGSYKGQNKVWSRIKRVTPVAKAYSDLERIWKENYMEELKPIF